MATAGEISVTLPADMLAMIGSAVARGDYASASEVVCEALYAWKFQHGLSSKELDELKRALQEGIDSGPGIDAEELFSRLRSKYRHRALT